MNINFPVIFGKKSSLDTVFNGVSAAWPLSEGTDKMRREAAFGNGLDFLPQNVTTVGGQSKFSGAANSYMATEFEALALGSDTAFTWTFTLKPTSLGAGTKDVLVLGEQPYPAFGSYRIYLSGSTLNFRCFYGAGSFTAVTATITNGVNNIITLGHDPVNNLISIKVNNGAVITTAHTGGTRFNYGALTLGNTPPTFNVSSYDGAISNLIFWKGRYLTSAEQTTLYNILNAGGFPYAALPEQDYFLNPDSLDAAEKRCDLDFTDLAYQWQDLAQTVPVVNNNDPVRRIVDRFGNFTCDAPSNAVRPLTKAATLGGYNTSYANGIDTRMNLSAALQSVQADFHLVVIAKNDRNSSGAGSHWTTNQAGTNSYITQTGSDYGGGYLAAHKTLSGSGFAPNSGQINNPTGFNIFEVFSLSTIFAAIANGGVPTSLATWRGVNTNPADYNTLYKDTKAGLWWALGNLGRLVFLKKTTNAATRARIRNYYKIRYGLTNVIFAGY